MKIFAIPANRLSDVQIAAWSKLQRADSTVDNPFFRPEFTLAVAEVCRNVEVGILQEGDEFVGFFPFQREADDVGKAVAWRLSDLHGVVVRKGTDYCPRDLVRECGLTVWHFDHLPATQTEFEPFHQAIDDSPYIDLRNGFEAYQQQRREAGSSAVTQSQRKMRKFSREVGPVRFEYHTTDSAVFEALVNWKRDQLKRQGYFDFFQFDGIVDLLDRLRVHNTEGFSGVLSALYAGDSLVAVHLGLESDGILSSWKPTFDDSFRKYSPGLILHVEMARHAAEKGIQRIDLGRGENQMKTSLMSDAFDVALGSVDLRPLNRVLSAAWYRTRDLVYATPLKGAPLKMYRRIRNWIVQP